VSDAEVKELWFSDPAHHDIAGLDVAVDYLLAMGVLDCSADRGEQSQAICEGRLGSFDEHIEWFSMDELHDEDRRPAIAFLDAIELGDVPVGHSREHPGLVLEQGLALGREKALRDELQRNVTVILRPKCGVDLAHGAAAELALNVVGPDLGACAGRFVRRGKARGKASLKLADEILSRRVEAQECLDFVDETRVVGASALERLVPMLDWQVSNE